MDSLTPSSANAALAIVMAHAPQAWSSVSKALTPSVAPRASAGLGGAIDKSSLALPGVRTTLDSVEDVIPTAVELLRTVGSTSSEPPEALDSALQKLETMVTVSGGSLADLLGEMLRLQSKQSDQRTHLATGQIEEKFRTLQQQIQKQLEQIQKRIEASKSSGFFGMLIGIFKAIATVVTSVAGVVSGNPLLMVAAGLAIASVITSLASNSDAAGWISMGLGIVGAACSLGATLGQSEIPVLSGLAKLISVDSSSSVQLGSTLGSVGATATGSALAIPKAMADGDVLKADADLLDLKAWGKQLLRDVEYERGMIETMLDGVNRSAALVRALFDTHAVAEQAATEGGA